MNMEDNPETPKSESTPSGDGKMAEVMEKLLARLDEPSAAPSPPADSTPAQTTAQPRIYRASELQEMVDAGSITMAQKDEQLQAQQQYHFQQQLDARTAQLATQTQIQREIERYMDARPTLRDPKTEDVRKVWDRAHKIATRFGVDARDLRVQAQALEEIYGSPEKAKPVEETTRDRKATNQRSGASSPGSSPASDDSDGQPRGLSDYQRQNFEGGIQRGRYSGWKDPMLRRELARWRAQDEEWAPEKLKKELARWPLKKKAS